MPKRSVRPQRLDECVPSISSITSRNISQKSVKEVGDLYLASLSLLYHLKADQVKLERWQQQRRSQTQDKIISPLSRDETPAIYAILHNPRLFRALLSCLKAPTANEGLDGNGPDPTSLVHRLPSSSTYPMPQGNRKRSMSYVLEHDNNTNSNGPAPPMKSMKVMHSPTPPARSAMVQKSDPTVMAADVKKKPYWNVPVVAACILYTAFAHLDHWPVALVQAYAEDCFGARCWVDAEECKLLAQNLALVHTEVDHMQVDGEERDRVEREKEAAAVVEYFQFLETTELPPTPSTAPSITSLSPTNAGFLRRGSLSSDTGSVTAVLPRFTSMVDIDSPEKLRRNPIVTRVPSDNKSSNQSDSDSELPGNKGKIGKQDSFNDDGGSSSSSGEEDEEEVVAMTESFDAANVDTATGAAGVVLNETSNGEMQSDTRTYPIAQTMFNLTRIRPRYYGINLEHAHLAISSSLSTRLDVKAKQNSGLLQALPHFCAVPAVRSLVAQQLERWLQSPALSGLARALFVATVNQMKHVQPTLPEDVDAIDCILRMKLKANQLNAHIDNVTAIARRIPTAAVSRQIYVRLLREVLQGMESTDRTNPDHLKMLTAVHNAFPANLSAEGLGEALLTLLAHPNDDDGQQQLSRPQRDKLVRKLRTILRDVASAFGTSFDGCGLLEALLSFDLQVESWTMRDEEDKGRLMYQCAILLVGAPPSSEAKARQTVARGRRNSNFEEEGGMKSRRNSSFDDDGGARNRRNSNFLEVDSAALRKKLMHARKLLLNWCCTDYSTYCCAKSDTKTTNGKRRKQDDMIGEMAGMPDFRSILNEQSYDCLPSLRLMRCVLFMEFPDSPYLQQFLYPDGSFSSDDNNWQDEKYQIAACCELGSCLDNDMLRIVLEYASLPNEGISESLALSLIEHLVEFCNKGHTARLLVTDPILVTQLYELTVYSPPPRVSDERERRNGDGSEAVDDVANRPKPRLAYPGRWWRITALMLALCGASPERIGSFVWQEYPTLKALMKMVTSRRYRFPTVDCDDSTREEVKKAEASLRNEETRIAEVLFLPPKAPTKVKGKLETSHGGSRVSKRQKDKQERLQRQQREKEAAEAHEEAVRRKRILRSAQKSIMLWDPKGPARKPPRVSVELLLSVERLFGLSEVYQTVANPDFVLGTIGNTTRGAIERAYDWLIPIISSLPDTIARLPANASCFLLLRAYGTDGGERAKLKELSKPLLVHIRDCLSGKFGLNDALRAADLLLSDVASPKADIRRCARRVLQESIGRIDGEEIDAAFRENNCSWMLSILKSEHADVLVGESIKHLSLAVSYERGKVLRALVMALEKYYAFAKEKGITVQGTFQHALFELLSNRPSVCVEAMEDFPDLQAVAVQSVFSAFKSHFGKNSPPPSAENDETVTIVPNQKVEGERGTQSSVGIPFQLMQSICVVLSTSEEEVEGTEATPVQSLVEALLQPQDENGESTRGLAGASFSSGKRAVPVDSWVLLAKSRSDFVAKHAALSAPANFIPRLLLCSGLPHSSLQTMLDRLGRLGDQSNDKSHVFSQLLAPSATSDWDVGRFITRRALARKLVGRLAAYGRKRKETAKEEADISSSFLEWLSKECKAEDKPKKKKQKKITKCSINGLLSNTATASVILEKFDLDLDGLQEAETDNDADILQFQQPTSQLVKEDFSPSLGVSDIEAYFTNGKVDSLAGWLESQFPTIAETDFGAQNFHGNSNGNEKALQVAEMMLQGVLKSKSKQDSLMRLVMKWIPSLTQLRGSEELWRLLLCSDDESLNSLFDILMPKCIQVWTSTHLVSCRNWILSIAENQDSTTNARLLRFLVLTSGHRCVNTQSFCDRMPDCLIDMSWGKSQEFVNSCMALVLNSFKSDVLEATPSVGQILPDWLTLLLLLASQGRNQVRLITTNILRRLTIAMEKTDEATCYVLRSALLRVYFHFPFSMDLGNSAVRTALVDAADFCVGRWQKWNSSLDDQIGDMVESVLNYGTPRLVQALCDLAKNHPLFILRKLPEFTRALEVDALAGNVRNSTLAEKRGVVVADNVSGLREAMFGGRIVQVNIKHWGYSYSEMVWSALLDIVLAIPRPLLFQNGLKLGALAFFEMYVRLLYTQSQLRRNPDDPLQPRLKAKVTSVFAMWKELNPVTWEDWLTSTISGLESLGVTRSVLVVADLLSPQEAIESLRSRGRTT